MDDYYLRFSQFVDEWLNWQVAAMLLGLAMIFILPLSVHQRARQEQEVGRGFAFHFGAEIIAVIGLLLLLWGLLNYEVGPVTVVPE